MDIVMAKGEKYTLRKVKTFRGMDGEGLNAELCRDGKPVAFVMNEGSGGMTHFDWLDRKHGKSSEEDLFGAFISEEKQKADDTRTDELGNTDKHYFDGEIWVHNTVDRMLNDKRFRRLCKTNIVFQVGAKIGSGEFQSVKGLDLRAHIEKKYKGQKVRILNDEFKD